MNNYSVIDLIEKAKMIKAWESHDWKFKTVTIDKDNCMMEYEIQCSKCNDNRSTAMEACFPFASVDWMLTEDHCLGVKT